MQPIYQPERTRVDVCYRKNLAEYNAWDAEQQKKQAEAVQALIRRERRPIRLPRWFRTGFAILATGLLVWAFVSLVFSFRG